MGLKDMARNWIINLLGQGQDERTKRLEKLRDYYEGNHPEQLKVRPNRFNDNLAVNFCGLIVDKAVSALVGDPSDGQGLSWSFPSEDGETVPKQIAWLDAQWEAANRDIFLHLNALTGARSGVPAVKLIPDGMGNVRPITINPVTLTVETDPQDAEKIIEYKIAYSVTENGKDVEYKEETKPDGAGWVVELKRKQGGDRWEIIETTPWPYDFPPILMWQNLPSIDSPYGRSDIEGIIEIQDRYNFLVSNISKIIRLFAHPNRYTKNLTAQTDANGFSMGPDEMPMFSGDGEIVQLPVVGDMVGAMQFLQSLRESAFVLSREIDTQSMKDKVGAITNFALRVLYRDFLDKLGTKRMLYGSAYQELNRRMLVLGGFKPETCVISWPDPLPVNEVEETQAITSDLANGLVDKQTASEIRGYDWEKIQERMGTQQESEQNIGASLLNQFLKTGSTNQTNGVSRGPNA